MNASSGRPSFFFKGKELIVVGDGIPASICHTDDHGVASGSKGLDVAADGDVVCVAEVEQRRPPRMRRSRGDISTDEEVGMPCAAPVVGP